MERAIIVRGRISGPRRIDLEEPLDEVTGDVELVVRSLEPVREPPAQDVFDFVRALPPGTRTKEDIDRQVAEEHDAWGDR